MTPSWTTLPCRKGAAGMAAAQHGASVPSTDSAGVG